MADSIERPTRVLLFTGKGGVGKTTSAAATAVRCAAEGHRTLVVSTDPAHSLADALDVELGDDPSEVATNLYAQQLDTRARLEASWGELREWLQEVFDWAGMDAVEAEEMAVLPGLDEVFALADIREHAESDEWDVLVVDCAPTAETIRLLSFPEVLAWYMERVFPLSRRVNRLVSPVLSRVTNLPVAGDEVFGASRRFYERLEGVRELLADSSRSSIRLVVNPERIVVAEARRTYTYLSLFGYATDAVVANRVLPEELVDPFFDAWKRSQAEHLSAIEEGFAPLPVLRCAMAAGEPVGLEALTLLAEDLYGDLDPTDVLHEGSPLTVSVDGADATLELDLPFAEKGDLDVARRGDDLLVGVGPQRRILALPDSLLRRVVTGASLQDGRLRVTFGPVPEAADRGARERP